DVRKSGVPGPIGPTVIDVRNEAGRLLHRNERLIERIPLTAAPPEVGPQLSAGLEQKARSHRRLPAHLRHHARMVFVGHGPFWRADRRAKAQPGTVAAHDAVDAGVLDAVEEGDLVARRQLPGQPHVLLVPRAVADRLTAIVWVVGPFRGIARVL